MSGVPGDVRPAPPQVLRRLRSLHANAVAELAATFEDLQTVLRCCERLLTELAAQPGPDDVVVEAVWTTALLSYARCFRAVDGGAALTRDDLVAAITAGDVADWHTVLLQLRDHYASDGPNPRERFSVGVAQDEQGGVGGVAITSARQPLVDELTVRQTGAIAFALSAHVNERITTLQEQILVELAGAAKADLDQLELLEVAPPDERG
ncbi:MAG: hypothetical protein ABIV05_06350 [Actinomycetota bacterium]